MYVSPTNHDPLNYESISVHQGALSLVMQATHVWSMSSPVVLVHSGGGTTLCVLDLFILRVSIQRMNGFDAPQLNSASTVPVDRGKSGFDALLLCFKLRVLLLGFA
jgi:hypothetical protein